MMKRTTHIRAPPEVKDKLDQMSREISIVQKQDIKTPEVLRRITNIPGLRETLLRDAEAKRRFRA